MLNYILRRLLLIIPTFFGITFICFVIINFAPGSPIEQKLREIRFGGFGAAESMAGGAGAGDAGMSSNEEVIEALKKQYGFDKPWYHRYWIWLVNIFRLDFGESFTYQQPVIKVIASKLPVSIQFGLSSFFLTYLVCLILGVAKAVRMNTPFDTISTFVLFIMYSIPPLILGLLLITFFATDNFFPLFPIGGLVSNDYEYLSFWEKVWDRIYHFVLPLICYMIGSFTALTLLVRNSMLEVIHQDYIRAATAKGLSEKVIYYKHALRNALIPVATGVGSFLGIFLEGSLIIETVFNLDGIGLLGYKSVLSRDYNVMMAMIFISSLVMLLGRLISDLTYILVDPRIDFS